MSLVETIKYNENEYIVTPCLCLFYCTLAIPGGTSVSNIGLTGAESPYFNTFSL